MAGISSNPRRYAIEPLHRVILSELSAQVGVDVVELVIDVDVNRGPVLVDKRVEPIGGIANPCGFSGGRGW
jgi:hypothetical protein